ncbi:hypothetical protein AXG93_4012s1280 [Marchantia polymorpha subsp. ruderalis]|uniref:F-box domain-containing protein n=1 Tax=Marchantia polymorpha subsp. ruderalis TaxID=1480154 RepID=A0A176VKW1_MARPO|nr:hypothetical protein AXG93_4012s1280 [Marchantia polymorpha subsp. ruderalis]
MLLEELPEDCIESIISYTSPWYACRLACLNRTLASAVRSDTVWGGMLPSDHALVYPRAAHLSKREIVEALAEGISLDQGRQRYVLLRRSGGICRQLSVAAILCTLLAQFITIDPMVAHLLAVCWLEVTGTWKCSLPPGIYSVVWRLKVANPQGGRCQFLSWKKPLSFVVNTSDDQDLEKELDLGQIQTNVFEEWFEFEVGQIVVRGKGREVKQLHLFFSIKEVDCTYWKGGLFLDCLALRPATAQDEPVYTKPSRADWKKMRVRPGVF